MSVSASSLVIILALLLMSCDRGPEDGVAASVNGHKITYAELEKYYQSQVRDMAEAPTEEQERMLRLTLLREVIDRQIMLQRAERLGFMAVDAEVKESLKKYRSPFANEEEFRRNLEERDLTLEDLENELRRSLMIEKLFNGEIAAKISVTDAEMHTYYEENKASFNIPEQQVHLAQILVTAAAEVPVPNHRNDDARDLQTAQQKIQMIEQRLKNGEDFAVLAQEYSEDPASTASGGDLGFIPQSALGEADLTLRRVVASLSPGEVSPVIKTGDEFRIIKLNSMEPAGQREFSHPRVQQVIRETLMNRKHQLLKAAYMEVARNEAKVENYLAQRVVSGFGPSD